MSRIVYFSFGLHARSFTSKILTLFSILRVPLTLSSRMISMMNKQGVINGLSKMKSGLVVRYEGKKVLIGREGTDHR